MNSDGTFSKDDPRINRKGRKKGSKNFATILKKVCAEMAEANEQAELPEETKQERICRLLVEKAILGNADAAKEVMDRMDGRPRQVIETISESEEIGGMKDEELIDFEAEERRAAEMDEDG